MSPIKTAVIFEHIGPYHVARIRGADDCLDVIPIELFANCNTYAWESLEDTLDINREILFVDRDSDSVSKLEIRKKLYSLLGSIRPEVLAVHGWSLPGAISAISWASINRIPVVVMSESKEEDFSRSPPKELIKKSLLRHVSAGFVGADSHKNYLVQLGMPSDGVFLGYDAVDNTYFSSGAALVRRDEKNLRQKFNLPEWYFFASSRFIEKKNLAYLIQAFHHYSKTVENPWHLILAGDGPLKESLMKLVKELSLQNNIHLVGFLQYDQLPIYYGLASAFIHVSTTEQWGLVVNEAAASSLPLIVSDACGCAPHLLRDGENGFECQPDDIYSIADSMMQMTNLEISALNDMGRRSSEIISDYGPGKFGEGLLQASEYALDHPKSVGLLDGIVLSLLK